MNPSAVPRPPLPEDFGIVLDAATRRIDGGSALVGGSPLTILRLSDAGAGVVDALVAGGNVPVGGAAKRLARRLVDLGLAHPRPPHPGDPAPAVTVVIPVRDEAEGLAITLASLGPAERVIVVDDGSADSDAVPAVAGRGPQPERTHVIRLDRSRGPGGARQVGWEAATTEVVAFLDAGCEPVPGWLEPLAAHLADRTVVAVAPRVRARAGPAVAPRAPARADPVGAPVAPRVRTSPGTPAWLAAYEAARSPLDLGGAPAAVRPRSPVSFVPAAALVVRRAALEAVGGFDPALRVGEDVDLVWRLAAAGWSVRYEPAATVTSTARPTLAALLSQRFGYGRSAAPLAARHGPAVAPLAVSTWSATAWGLAALGHPLLGAGVAGASTAALAPRLRGLRHPWPEAVRLAGGGHLRAAGLLTEACRRSWWPLVGLACLCSRRARRLALAAAVVPPLLDRRTSGTSLGVPAWLALRLADDLAYGAGVWAGAIRAGSAAALRPSLGSGPGRRRTTPTGPAGPSWSSPGLGALPRGPR